MPKRMRMAPFADDVAERVAHIMGASSATARALAECRRRRAAGEDVHLWRAGSMILVGPTSDRPAPEPPGASEKEG